MKKVIYTSNAPEALGPYSQAIQFQNLLFTSGQIGIDPATNEIADNISEQTHQVMKNLNHLLAEAKTSLEQVMKTTIYLQDMNDFTVINEIYGSYFTDTNYPARETVEVARLPRNVKIEISMIAYISS